jgi:hypothetical protein
VDDYKKSPFWVSLDFVYNQARNCGRILEMHHSTYKMRAAILCFALGLATAIVASPTASASPTMIGLWQPLEGQVVLDLEVVYGNVFFLNIQCVEIYWHVPTGQGTAV